LVAVRFVARPGDMYEMAARSLAKERAIYRLEDPPENVHPNVVDRIWTEFESHLPRALRAVEQGSTGENDWDAICDHLIAQAVRHPDFEVQARHSLANKGISVPNRDLIQIERVRTLRETPRLLAECRLAFLHRSPDGPRFVVNHKGYGSLEDPAGRKGVFFPLSGSVGVLAVVGVGEFEGRPSPWVWGSMTLTPGGVELLNQACWRVPGIRFVIGHPEDSQRIAELSVDVDLMAPALGPFRGLNKGGLFDWAFTDAT
jgi:hypothetical protein